MPDSHSGDAGATPAETTIQGVAQSAARVLGVHEVAGSSPAALTIAKQLGVAQSGSALPSE